MKLEIEFNRIKLLFVSSNLLFAEIIFNIWLQEHNGNIMSFKTFDGFSDFLISSKLFIFISY